MSRFQNKNVVITGGTSGIGLATAKRIVDEGGQVLVTGSRDESIASAKEQLGDSVTYLKNDAGSPTAPHELADFVSKNMGKIDGAFLNAGYGHFIPLENVDAETFDKNMDVNVRGPLLQSKALAPQLADGGSIVITSSVVKDLGLPASHIYTATKGAVRALVRSLARDFSNRQIRVNSVSPGPIDTSFFDRTGMSADEQEETAEQIQGMVPLARFGRPEEVAAVASFLLSSDASYVTGSEYTVDGGMSEL